MLAVWHLYELPANEPIEVWYSDEHVSSITDSYYGEIVEVYAYDVYKDTHLTDDTGMTMFTPFTNKIGIELEEVPISEYVHENTDPVIQRDIFDLIVEEIAFVCEKTELKYGVRDSEENEQEA